MNRVQGRSQFPIFWSFICLAALFFAPYLLGLSAFSDGDFNRHYLPYSFFQQKSLLAGQLPVWNPHVNSGHPFLADTESAVFYPVSNILLLLTSISSSVVGRLYWLQVEALVHIILACSFTFLLVHRLTGNRMAGFAAGLVFGFSGYLTGYPPLQLGILRVAVWLPLILWLLLPERTGIPKLNRWLWASAVHAVAFFANHPQTFLYLTYAVGGWMLMLALTGSSWRALDGKGIEPGEHGWGFSSKRLLLHLGGMITYAAILVSLTVAQLWPALEFTALSVRSARPFYELSSGFPLRDMWQILVPSVLSHYSPLYIGIAGLGLAGIGVGALLSNRFSLVAASPYARPAAIFFIVTGCLSVLVSFGEILPLYPLLYRFAPGWSLFRGQERIAYLCTFSLSVWSGYGLALLPTLGARWRQRFGWGYLLLVAGGTALVFAIWQFPGQLDTTEASFLFHAGKSILLAAIFSVLCSSFLLSRTRLIVFLVVLVVDLFVTNITTNLANGHSIRSALTQPEIAATLKASQRFDDESSAFPPRVYNERRLPEDTGMMSGWEDVWAASVLRLSAYNGLFVDFPLDRMWKLTGVGTVLTWRQELTVDSLLVEEFPLENESTRLHILKTLYPRMWWAQKARRMDDLPALTLLADPSFDPLQEVLIANSDAESLGEGWNDGQLQFGSGGEASLEAERIGPTDMEVLIESNQPGLLFVSENYMPGWLAEWTATDETSQPISLPVVRANQAFLGIPIPAGRGTLELAYRPASVRWGLSISALTWVTLLLVLRRQLLSVVGTVWRHTGRTARVLRQLVSSKTAIRGGHSPRQNESEEIPSSSHSLFSDTRFQHTLVLLATLAGFALRSYQLGYQELVPGEALYYWYSQLPLSSLLQMFAEGESAAFSASFWLNHFWLRLAGSSEFALRSVAALLGTLAIPLIFWLAKELRVPTFAALIATLLMAMGTFAVRSSQDVLLYPLSLALLVTSAALALRLISGSKGRTVFLAYALCTAAAVYTQVFAVLALLAQNLYMLYVVVSQYRSETNYSSPRPYRSMLVRWAWAQLAIAVLCIPWLLSARNGTFELTGFNTDSSVIALLWWRFAGYPIGELVPARIWLLNAGILGIVSIAAAVIGLLLPARGKGNLDGVRGRGAGYIDKDFASATQDESVTSPVHSPIVFSLLLLAMAPLANWDTLTRHWFLHGSLYAVTLPPYLLLMAIGLTRIGAWTENWLGWRWRAWIYDEAVYGPSFLARIRVGGVVAVSLVSILVAGNLFTWRNYHFDPKFSSSRNLRQLSAAVERWGAGLYPDQVHILQSFPDPTLFLYYYKGGIEHSVLPGHDHSLEGASAAVNALSDSDIQRIILPVSLNDDQEGPDLAKQALARSYQLAGQEALGPWLLELYSRPYHEAWRLFDVEFDNGLVLERAQVSPHFPPSGGRLVVHFEWKGDPAALTGGEKIFMHLLDENGNLVAQWDPELQMDGAAQATATAMPVPAILPAGSLRLVAGLYDVTKEGAPRILTTKGEDFLQLAYFHVTDCDVCGR